MPEEDGKIFGEAYQLYDKWRGQVIGTAEKWLEVTNEIHGFYERHEGNALALRLSVGIWEALEDLYRGGKVPAMPDYIGRSDL